MSKQTIGEKMLNIVVSTVTRDLTRTSLNKVKNAWKNHQDKTKVRKRSDESDDELEP
jgi:hypothetical protein